MWEPFFAFAAVAAAAAGSAASVEIQNNPFSSSRLVARCQPKRDAAGNSS